MISKRAMILLSKLASYPIYYTGLYALLSRIFRENGIIIVFYHRIGVRGQENFDSTFMVDRNSLRQQLRYFKGHYEVISMDEAVSLLNSGRKLDKRYLVVTFDDGYRDNQTLGVELFRRLDIRPVIYLTAGNIEHQQPLWPDHVRNMLLGTSKKEVQLELPGWQRVKLQTPAGQREGLVRQTRSFRLDTAGRKDKAAELLVRSLKSCPDKEKRRFIRQLEKMLGVTAPQSGSLMLDWARVSEMAAAGFLFGGHTMTHPILSQLPADALTGELLDPARLIEARAGIRPEHFAYPNGKEADFNDLVKSRVSRYYRSAVTTLGGINTAATDAFELRRIGLSYDMNAVEARVKILVSLMLQRIEGKRERRHP